MTATVQRRTAGVNRERGQDGESSTVAVTVSEPPKARRRWGLLAAMVALVCVGALGNVWLLGSISDSSPVLVATSPIERGAVVSRDALGTVSVGLDPAVQSVPASRLGELVGQRAVVDIAAGSLLTPASTTSENVPAAGLSLVGVSVTSAMMPGARLLAGDRVRVVATPGLQGELTSDGVEAGPEVFPAIVVSVVAGTDVTGVSAQTVVTVQVPEMQAPALASAAATGRVAIVLDSRDR